jgi:hypothetical protein
MGIYEKVFNPCYIENEIICFDRCWKFSSGTNQGQAFPMSLFGDTCRGSHCAPPYGNTFDSLYVKEGYSIQIFSNTEELNDPSELITEIPLTCGPQYVADGWAELCGAEFEPNTLIVYGNYDPGILKNYSIVIYRGCYSFAKVDDVNDNECVVTDSNITYTISYDFNDTNSFKFTIVDYLPTEVDHLLSPGGDYNDANRTVT